MKVFIGLVSLIFVVYWVNYASYHNVENKSASEPTREVFRTNAIDIFNAYDSNEVATDENLKGKIIEISGIIESIDKNFEDAVVIVLETGEPFMSAILHMLDSEKQKAATLRKGQEIVIRCVGMKRIIGSPSGTDCTFYQQSTDYLSNKMSNANATESEFKNSFACPESLETEDLQKQALASMVEWYGAHNKVVSIEGLLTFRMKLLEDHHCEVTLNNIR